MFTLLDRTAAEQSLRDFLILASMDAAAIAEEQPEPEAESA